MNHQSSVIIHQSSIISQSFNQRSIRHHLDVIWGSFGGHIGIIWTSSGVHLGIIWGSTGTIWGSSGTIWGSSGHHLGIIWGPFGSKKAKMVDETGRHRSQIGNFDTGRCASISGPRKSRFWPTIPNLFKENLDYSPLVGIPEIHPQPP